MTRWNLIFPSVSMATRTTGISCAWRRCGSRFASSASASNVSAPGPIFGKVGKVIKPPVGEVYHSIEAPKGELGYYVVSDGTVNPYRVRVRPPSLINLQALEKMAEGHLIADIVAIIGTLDIVLGEVDR